MISAFSLKHFLQRRRSYLRTSPIWHLHLRHSRLSLPNLREWVLQRRLGIVVKIILIFIINPNFMLFLTPTPTNSRILLFLPLLAIIILPPLHIALLTALFLLRPSTADNYCNALASILISVVILFDNCIFASNFIFEQADSSFTEMQSDVLKSWQAWLLLL